MDILLSLLALIALSPVYAAIALAICLDDPRGGPFYVSERCKKHGELFRFYKFRSMIVGADEQLPGLLGENEADGPVFKIRDDPRRTRVGKFLRRTGLDELPQLINVLKGDLSLVGPRPPLPREVERYTPEQRRRLDIRPGLTCYWQVQPHRNDKPFDEWVALDMKYIAERSLWVDLKIMAKTLRAMVRGEGL